MHAPEHFWQTRKLYQVYTANVQFEKEFSGKNVPIPLTSAQQYHIYIHGRLQKFLYGGGGKPIKGPHIEKKDPYMVKKPPISTPKRTKLHNKQTFWRVYMLQYL